MPAEVPTSEEFAALSEGVSALAAHVEGIEEQISTAVYEAYTVDDLRLTLDALRGDGGTIHLTANDFLLTEPLTLPSYVRLVGAGTGATSIRAAADMEYLVGVEDYASSVSLEKLRLDCAGKARTGIRIVPAPRDPRVAGKDYGITSPDPRHRLFDLEVYDAAHTGVALGEHARGTRLNHVLVRRAGTVGFHCSMADSYVTNCEATVVKGAPYSGASAFWVGSVNSVYANCKGWWGRGSGFRVRGTRNRFVACESQDTAWHGWYVEYDKNTLTGCVAENAGFKDAGGIGGVDGFYVVGAGSNTVGGCHARNRSENGASQRHGFSVPAAMLEWLPDSGSKTPRLYGESGYLNLGRLVNVRP